MHVSLVIYQFRKTHFVGWQQTSAREEETNRYTITNRTLMRYPRCSLFQITLAFLPIRGKSRLS